MSNQIENQEVDLIEDINEEQLDELVEDVEVEDEELSEAAAKKEAKVEVEVDDDEGEVEDEDEEDDDDDEDDDEDEEEKSESKKKVAKEGAEHDSEKAADETLKSIEKSKPTTKAGMIKAMYDRMSEMKKDDLKAAYEAMFDSEKAADEAVKSIEKSAGEAAKAANFKEDLDALTESEESLTEGFREKASTIFEAAVTSKVSAIAEQLEEQKEQEIAEQVETVRSDLVEKIDGYMNYVVEQWMSENEVAVTNGLRTEIAEDFIKSLKSVFVENYIEVPESKVDVVDTLAEQVEELSSKLEESINDNIELAEQVADYRREEILREATVGMAETEIEKLRSLTEDLEYEDNDSFAKKVSTIKESYFKVTGSYSVEAQEDDQPKVESPAMAAYLKALSKSK